MNFILNNECTEMALVKETVIDFEPEYHSNILEYLILEFLN